ncbi:MAG: hypothetical protein J0H32_11325 [Rhizobiales bacterium]|nr:hypothetical protein [Hyphomicrobiales bacterium]
MRIGAWSLVAALLALLAGVGWYAYSGLTAGSAPPMPVEGVIALAAGATVSLIVGVGLMALVFYSSRHGYDDLPTRDDSDETSSGDKRG